MTTSYRATIITKAPKQLKIVVRINCTPVSTILTTSYVVMVTSSTLLKLISSSITIGKSALEYSSIYSSEIGKITSC